MSRLSLENITYVYKNSGNPSLGRPALFNVSCEFEDGVFYAVAGPSGSGKTTLLSIMAGLDSPHSGTILFEGQDLAGVDLDKYRRESISMIFQAFQLFPLLTALENVCYPMELNGIKINEAKKHAAELLTSVGIGEGMHRRYPSQLSGGEQQRVAIARALASGARVILADEPTGNLDTENGNRIIEILKHLAHDEGYCVVVVTHDLEIAAGADFVLRMVDGAQAE